MPMLTFPMPRLEVPVWPAWAPILHPPLRHPIISSTHRHPASSNPDVSTAFPGPIARCPDVTRAWRGDHFDLGRWRSHFDAQIEIDPGDSRCAQHCQGTQDNDYALEHQQALLGYSE